MKKKTCSEVPDKGVKGKPVGVRHNTRCCIGGALIQKPLCICMGRERRAEIPKSEYLLPKQTERLRDYDKYGTEK